jgi:hypothetical protein
MPVGIDLQLDAAVAENTFGHHRHHIHAGDFRGNYERCRLVIRIGRASTNGGHKGFFSAHNRAIPLAGFFEKRHHRFATRHRALEHHMRIQPHQLPVAIPVAIARSRSPRLDVAQHRTGVAANCVFSHGLAPS